MAFTEFSAPVQYEYKPLNLSAFMVPLAKMQEQYDAVAEERRIKQAQYIQTAKTGSRGFVVKLDGSVIQDTSTEPRLIIGKVVTGKIEDEQWRNIRR